MKYYVFSFIWSHHGSNSWNAGTDLHACNGVVELFEYIQSQPEAWAITSFAEITKKEFDAAKERGKLG